MIRKYKSLFYLFFQIHFYFFDDFSLGEWILEGLLTWEDRIMMLKFTSTIKVSDFAIDFTHKSEQSKNVQKTKLNQFLFSFFGCIEALMKP